jgi:hypothetical protein
MCEHWGLCYILCCFVVCTTKYMSLSVCTLSPWHTGHHTGVVYDKQMNWVFTV